jgi:Ca2+/Na+ antiporter
MIFLPVALLLFVVGLFVKYKKVTWLISGYNTASKEKKAEYDVEKLTKHVGNFLFILAGTYLFWGILLLLLPQYTELIIWLGFGSSFIVIIAGIIYLNTGKRLMKS